VQASIDQVDGGGVRRMTVSADLRGELRGDRRSAEEDFDVDETGRPDSVSLSSRSGGSFCPDSRRPSMMGCSIWVAACSASLRRSIAWNASLGIRVPNRWRMTSRLLCESSERARCHELVEAEQAAIQDPVG